MTFRLFDIFNSIQSKLIALFLLSVIFTMVIVVGFNQSVRNLALASADASLRVQAEQLVAEIDTLHETNLQRYAIASGLPALVNFLKLSPDEREDSVIREEVLQTFSTIELYPTDQFNVVSFALLDNNGINVLDMLPQNEGRDEAAFDYARSPLSSGLPFVSTIYFNTPSGQAVYYYSVPIRDTVPPRPIIGILRIQVPLGLIQNAVIRNLDDVSIHAVLINENGIRIMDTDNERLNFRSIRPYTSTELSALRQNDQVPDLSEERLVLALPSILPYLDDLDETLIITDSLHPDGDDYERERIALVPLESYAWTMLYAQSAEVFFTPINQQTQGTLILSAVLSLGAVVIAFFFARSLSEPIAKLTEIAQRAAKGDLDVQAEVMSQDEVGALALAFNRMIVELKLNKSQLEHRVAERTEAYAQANRLLTAEITERERLEARNIQLALESERTRILAEFIQNVSHEFKTPLSVINVQSHLLKRIAGDAVAPRVAEIVAQSKNIETLVNEMVLMSRLDSDSYPMRTERIHIDGFIESVCNSEARRFDEQSITLTKLFAAHGCYVLHNSEMLFNALKLIFDNAIRYTSTGGTVSVQTMNNDDTVIVMIKDSGIGIPEDSIERVFERFYRVDSAHTTRGFGLGLPIAKRIIERFDGTIDISSQVDVGTKVQITLPVHDIETS